MVPSGPGGQARHHSTKLHTSTWPRPQLNLREMLLLSSALLVSGLLVPSSLPAARPSPRSPRPVAVEDSTDLLKRIEQQRAEGKTYSEILADVQLNAMASAQVAAQGGDASAPAPPTPQRGTESWGRWSQSDEFITIEYFLA